MKNYNIILIYLITYFFISLILTSNIQSIFDKIVVFWLIFDILIAIFETLLFFNYKYIVYQSKTKKEDDIMNKETSFKESFNYKYWLELWKEYGINCDKRYNKEKNLVHWIELSHAITSIPFIYLIYKYINEYKFSKTDGILMIIISTVHIFGTILYLISLYYDSEKGNQNLPNKFYIYKSTNYVWLIIPLFVLVKGIFIVL